MDKVIYWFSGTGNSLAVARRLANALPDYTCLPLAAPERDRDPPANCLGLVFPVYSFGPPRAVLRFLETVDLSAVRYVFTVATYGLLAGSPHRIVRNRLHARGADLQAGWSLQMPHNYTPMGSPPKPATRDRQRERARLRLEEAAEAIQAETPRRLEDSVLPLRLLFAGIRALAFPRFPTADRLFRVDATCTSCGTCESVCPVRNIRLEDGRPRWLGQCEQCLACLQWCPVECIQFGPLTEGRARYHHPDVQALDLAINLRDEENETPAQAPDEDESCNPDAENG